MCLNSEFKMVDTFKSQKLMSRNIFKDKNAPGLIYEYFFKKNSLLFCNANLRIQCSGVVKQIVWKDFFFFSTLASLNNGILDTRKRNRSQATLKCHYAKSPSDCKYEWIAESYLLKIVLTITSDISIFATVKHQVIFLYEMSLTRGPGVLLPACTEIRFPVSL